MAYNLDGIHTYSHILDFKADDRQEFQKNLLSLKIQNVLNFGAMW